MTDRWAVAFVHGVIAALAAAGVWYVHHHGSSVPIMDEWDLLAEWRASDSTAGWLFAHHNEHRYPLAKAVWLAGLRATGFDFKPLLFVPLALLVAAGVLLAWAARAGRGRQHPLDIVPAALLLHWGHGFNWLMAYQLGFAAVAWAAAGWMWAAARWGAGGDRRWAAVSLAYAVVLVPCGGFGVAFAPAVAGWCGWVAWRCRGWVGASGAVLALGTVAYTAFVLLTLPPTRLTDAGIRPTADPVGFLAAMAGYLGVAVGAWPAGEPLILRAALAVIVLGIHGAALRVVVIVGRGGRHHSPVVVAGAAVLVGTVLTAAAAAFGRGEGYIGRLADASAAGLGVSWLLATRALPSGRPVLGWSAALAITAAVFARNVSELGYAANLRHPGYQVERDLRDGLPAFQIVARHGHSLAVLVGDRMAVALARLKAAGIRPYAGLPEDPPLRARPAPGLLPPVLASGEYPLPAAPPDAVALRLRVTGAKVPHRDVASFRWTDPDTRIEREEAVRVPPLTDGFDLLFVLPDRPVPGRLRLGEQVRQLIPVTVEYLCR